jgi:hypothetical protein
MTWLLVFKQGRRKMRRENGAWILFGAGLAVAAAFAGIGTLSLMRNLRNLTMAENNATVWAAGGALFRLWALSVTSGSILTGIGAFLYVKTRPVFTWLTGCGVLAAVFLMVMIWARVYYPALFGIGGFIILLCTFAGVWVWMKKHAGLGIREKIAGSYKLVGYIFWINASWFLCGETAKMHLKAFAGTSAPSPVEVMVFLILGWLFVLLGDYEEMKIKKR